MTRLMLAVCFFCVSCSRPHIERIHISNQGNKISSLNVNSFFKVKDIKGSSIYFLPLDFSLLDSHSKDPELANEIKINFEKHWCYYFEKSIKGRMNILPQVGKAQYIASISAENIRGQNPFTLLNPLRVSGKIITYTVTVVDKQSSETVFGLKGEWIYSGPVSLAFLAEDVSRKMM